MDAFFDFAGYDDDLEASTLTSTSTPSTVSTAIVSTPAAVGSPSTVSTNTATSTPAAASPDDSPPKPNKSKNLSASAISAMTVDPHLATHEAISAYLAERDNNEGRHAQRSPSTASRTSPASISSQRQSKPRYSTSQQDHRDTLQIAHAAPSDPTSSAAQQTSGPSHNGLALAQYRPIELETARARGSADAAPLVDAGRSHNCARSGNGLVTPHSSTSYIKTPSARSNAYVFGVNTKSPSHNRRHPPAIAMGSHKSVTKSNSNAVAGASRAFIFSPMGGASFGESGSKRKRASSDDCDEQNGGDDSDELSYMSHGIHGGVFHTLNPTNRGSSTLPPKSEPVRKAKKLAKQSATPTALGVGTYGLSAPTWGGIGGTQSLASWGSLTM
ncbi:hypothetical protein LTR95_002743 [Oleoguttula sp. CCFEE 5521]